MSTCTRCDGMGAVQGCWAREACPECDGTGTFHVEPDLDKNVAGCLGITLLFGALLYVAAWWWAINYVLEAVAR